MKLMERLEVFQREVFPEYEQLFNTLAKSKSPETLVITCSDSRIDPALVTQTKPGDLFLIRNAGNIVPPHGKAGGEEATIEYALKALGIRNIVVCGHTDCGAMKAVAHPANLDTLPSVGKWLQPMVDALNKPDQDGAESEGDSQLREIIEQNVLLQIENLKTHPAVADALSEGKLHITGCVYEIESGDFYFFSPKKNQFLPFSEVERDEVRMGSL
jgi:carbonic anhydrase